MSSQRFSLTKPFRAYYEVSVLANCTMHYARCTETIVEKFLFVQNTFKKPIEEPYCKTLLQNPLEEKFMNYFVLAATFMFASNVFGYSTYLNQFVEHYSSNNISTENLTDEVACGLCHVSQSGGGRRTAYGESFADLVLAERLGFPGIEFIDSDGDSFLNLEEIYANSNPGSSESIPAARVIITVQGGRLVAKLPSTCKQLEFKSFGIKVDGKDSLVVSGPSAGQLTTLSFALQGNQGAVLAKCSEEKFVGSLLLK